MCISLLNNVTLNVTGLPLVAGVEAAAAVAGIFRYHHYGLQSVDLSL